METPDNINSPTEKLKIVVTSDAHDGSYYEEQRGKLEELSGDINLSIGDAFGSVLRDNIVAEYKKDNQGAINSLDEAERLIFDDLVKQNIMPIRAYWVAKIRAHPELLKDIHQELDTNYQIFAENFGTLSSPALLYGNVEEGYKSSPDFKDTEFANALDKVEHIQRPKILFETETAIGIAFPSMKRDEKTVQEVEEFIKQMEEKIASKPQAKQLVFFAHENLFKGPPPEQFNKSMKEASVSKYFIPFYMPNEYRKEILDFLFGVPEGINISFFYGHLHDHKEVTQTAFPLVNSDDGIGLKWGVNKVDQGTNQRRTRHFNMYQLPFQTIHTINIDEEGININKE